MDGTPPYGLSYSVTMQILTVTLKNFKTHRDRHFTFAPGTNAICGENGAGKTSILEAIAWTLFNYLGDYAKDDLIRNGSGSAEATVEFISSQDGRTYAVQRSTTKGYTIFDPQLNQRLPYTRIKDEVLPWLREHLGVAPGTDLGELFARTVGVPQGTFTADFLQSAENRKAVFDKVLRVEEYKTVYRELNSLRRYAEAKVEAVDAAIARYEERLATWEELQTRYQTTTADIAHNEAQLAQWQAQLATLETARAALKAQAEQIQQLQHQRQQVQAQMAGQQQAIALLTQSLAEAQAAADLCAKTRPGYEAYQAAEVALQTLSQQQQEQQTLQKRQQTLEKTLATRAADLTRLKVQLEDCEAAAAALAALQPQVEEQTHLEGQLADLQQQQTALAQVQGTLQATVAQAEHCTQQIDQLTAEIDQLQALAAVVATMPAIEQQRDRLQQQLSRLAAAQQFEADLQRLVQEGQAQCDRHQAQTEAALRSLADWQQTGAGLAAAVLTALESALTTGITVSQGLLAQVQQILTDLTTQTDEGELRSHLHGVQQQLATLAQQQAQLATLPARQQQLAQLQEQRASLSSRIETWQTQLSAGAQLAEQTAALRATLAALEDPKGRCALLARSRQQQPALQKRYDEMQAAQSGIEQQIAAVTTQIAAFGALEAAIAAQNQVKQTHQAAYRQYLQHGQAAQSTVRLTQELASAQGAIAQWEQEQALIQAQLEQLQADFDPQAAQQVEATYGEVRSQCDRLSGSLPQQRQMQAELQRQIDELQELAARRDAAQLERKQRDRIKRFINFARKAYKEAGPRITERYVQQVSREGDRLFRELLNRPNVALTWTRDYEILVQEGPNTRRFVNLSGGEQMCAALAVRLALLKVLADIDIAFFDEPTTNMDRPRRESLAEAIARLRSFNQLFVISHDDTFEKVTENVIIVERDAS
ncbi:MAG TPA: SMC family ATPase [Candidatus Obscuribacterales bacterium]